MFGRGDSRRKSRSRDARRLNFESLEHRVVMSATSLVPDESAATDPVASPEPTPLPALSLEDWVHGLLYFQFNQLTVDTVRYLTPQQVSTIPNGYDFAFFMSAPVRAALSQTQVQALRVNAIRLDYLTPQQISWLSVAQIQSLILPDFKFLSPAQVPSLSPAQIATIPDPGPFAEWSDASRAALTLPQIQALRVATVWLDRLTPTQISWLTAAQIQTLRITDFKYLSPSQVPHLTPAQLATIPDPGPFAEWTAASRAALTLPQIQGLNVGNVWLNRLTPTQITWLTAGQIRTLSIADYKYLSPVQTPYLTPAQIAAIPDPGPFAEWSAASRAALTLPQIQALDVANVWLDRLTAQQVSWLTVDQIRSLRIADFQYLGASQVPSLSVVQIASIPDPGPLAEWTASARAALTMPQVQVLRVNSIGASLLTPLQASWLTPQQIRSLRVADFQYLNVLQVPLLTTTQIAAITHRGLLVDWKPICRAALTQVQIQALKVGEVGLDLLTSQQIAWLTNPQIQSTDWVHFYLLGVNQIPILTPQQVASVPAGVLRSLPDRLQSALTREQLMGLSSEQISQYMVSLPAPYDSYTPAVDIPVGPDGIALSHHLQEEFQRVLNLVPLAAATHVAVASGNWADPRIWQGGRIPTAGARVVIAAGATVRFDASLAPSTAIKTLRIDGTLTFAAEHNTQLYVDTIVVNSAGKLHIGTAAAPIASHATARIVITGGGPIDTAWDPYILSRGLLSRGEVRMYGRFVTPYAAVSAAPVRGATQLSLSSIPANWRVGDKIVLTGTHLHVQGNQSEERVIRAISGNIITVDALAYDHVPPAGFGTSVYVANFTRNVQFVAAESAIPSRRPHMMFLHNPNVDIENISVVGFGRTDKTTPINDPVVVNGALLPATGTNVRARYAIHFHHMGVNPAYAPAIVRGSVVVDSSGWGFVNHSSNVLMQNNVSYNVVGAGFVAEDGNEIGDIVGNLAMNSIGSSDHIESRRNIHDWGHGGHGFWLQGPGVGVLNNIAVGHADAAYVYFTNTSKTLFDAVNLSNPALAGGRAAVPVGAAPIKAFYGNVAATSKAGLEIWFHQTFMNDGQSYIDNFKAWNIRSAGIFLFYTGRTTVRSGTLVGDMALFRGTGIDTIGLTHDVTIQNTRIEGFETGIVAPGRRTNVISGGVINAVRGIVIKGAHDTIRSLDIIGPITFKTTLPTQLFGRTPYQVYASAKVDFEFQTFESVFNADRIQFKRDKFTLASVYFPEQAANYVPFPRSEYQGIVPEGYLNLTNAELRAIYGVSLGGGFPPADAVVPAGYRALLDYTPGR
jgi:DNA polymerase III psi subunit